MSYFPGDAGFVEASRRHLSAWWVTLGKAQFNMSTGGTIAEKMAKVFSFYSMQLGQWLFPVGFPTELSARPSRCNSCGACLESNDPHSVCATGIFAISVNGREY